MEDLSSFWGRRIAWQTFICATIATAVAQLLNTSFSGFIYNHRFGLLETSVRSSMTSFLASCLKVVPLKQLFSVYTFFSHCLLYPTCISSLWLKWWPPVRFLWFQIVEPIEMHIMCIMVAVIMGLVGGLLGALFTHLNSLIKFYRKKLYSLISNSCLAKIAKITECMIIVVSPLLTCWSPLYERIDWPVYSPSSFPDSYDCVHYLPSIRILLLRIGPEKQFLKLNFGLHSWVSTYNFIICSVFSSMSLLPVFIFGSPNISQIPLEVYTCTQPDFNDTEPDVIVYNDGKKTTSPTWFTITFMHLRAEVPLYHTWTSIWSQSCFIYIFMSLTQMDGEHSVLLKSPKAYNKCSSS